MKNLLLVTTLLLAASSTLAAENVYLYDKIKIWSLTGPSNEYKVKYNNGHGDRSFNISGSYYTLAVVFNLFLTGELR